MKTLKQLGEFNFIDNIAAGCLRHKSVVKGIGDDAAVVQLSKDLFLLFTADMLIEDVHFKRGQSPQLIGHKAIACSLSDIAAMGGIPRYALVSVAFPENLKASTALGIYRGMQKTAKKFGLSIIGGDTNAADKIIIDVSMCGVVENNRFVLRGGAKKGDSIFVTGSLGGSQAGGHLKFLPRLKDAQFLVNNYPINAMIDISDGLISDLGHIIVKSKKGAVILQEAVPIAKQALSLEEAYYTGEDFELLFTISKAYERELISKWPFKKVQLSCIGEITGAGTGIKSKNKKGQLKNIKGKG